MTKLSASDYQKMVSKHTAKKPAKATASKPESKEDKEPVMVVARDVEYSSALQIKEQRLEEWQAISDMVYLLRTQWMHSQHGQRPFTLEAFNRFLKDNNVPLQINQIP